MTCSWGAFGRLETRLTQIMIVVHLPPSRESLLAGLLAGLLAASCLVAVKEADLRESANAGFSKHLVKPVDVTELRASIASVAATRNPRSA